MLPRLLRRSISLHRLKSYVKKQSVFFPSPIDREEEKKKFILDEKKGYQYFKFVNIDRLSRCIVVLNE